MHILFYFGLIQISIACSAQYKFEIYFSGLEKDEYDRERKFYRERGLPCPKDQALEEEKEQDAEDKESNTPDANTNMDFHRYDFT